MSRRLIIGVGLLVMGTGSALTGLANGFWQLFAARLFTGIGGAGNGPATYSILADYFPPAKLPKAIAFMNFGFTSGTGIALLLGGTLIAAVSAWAISRCRDRRRAWVAARVPGDGNSGSDARPPDADDGLRAAAARPGAGRGRKLIAPHQSAPCSRICGASGRPSDPCSSGLACNSLAMGTQVWAAAFYQRTYGWGPAQYGIIQGLVLLLIAPFGLAFGGWLAERWARQGRDDANLRVVLVAGLAHMPFAIAYALMPSPYLALAGASLNSVLILIGVGPQNAALQVIVPNEMRGQVTALFLFLFTMIGFGIAPTVVALLTDYVFRDELKLRYSIATMHARARAACGVRVLARSERVWPGSCARPFLAELIPGTDVDVHHRFAARQASRCGTASTLRSGWRSTCAIARSRGACQRTCAAASTASARTFSIRRACRTSRSTAKDI